MEELFIYHILLIKIYNKIIRYQIIFLEIIVYYQINNKVMVTEVQYIQMFLIVV